jgi:hypothetical protein
VLALGAARDARAYEGQVESSFAAQVYDVTSPFGRVLTRNRYTEMLSLKVYDLQGEHDPKGPSLDAVARLRIDVDLGVDPLERNALREDLFVPGLPSTPLDIMMAYVEGRNYGGGLVDFRLGRQYVVDALGWWSFDGGLVRLKTPAYVAFEGYGGFEQRGGLPLLATSRYEADGVYRGDRTGMARDLFPSYLDESKLAPAYGFAVESSGLAWLATRLTYRRVVNRDAVLVSPFPDENGNFARTTGDRVSTERVGWAGTAIADGVGLVRGDFVYDLYAGRPSEYAASVEWFAVSTVNLGADVEYFLPTFDGDSIWNWFAHFGTTTIDGRARWDVSRRLAVVASGGVRSFETEGDPAAVASGGTTDRTTAHLFDAFGALDGSYRWSDGRAAIRVQDERGERGCRRGADVTLKHSFVGGLYDVTGIASLYSWSDALRTSRDGESFLYVVGGGYRPFPRTRVGVEWEHSMSELVGQRFRALATLDLTVL